MAKKINKSNVKKILMTGGTGFIGKCLERELKKTYHTVSVYEGDISGINLFDDRYDVVCHLAAITNMDSAAGADLLFDTNVSGTKKVMEYCYKTGASCVLASSSAVYMPSVSYKKLNENSSIGPVNLYGISKVLSEDICKFYAKAFRVSIVSLRIFNVYGDGQEQPFIIPYIASQILNKMPVELKNPMAVRDFIYISDVVRAFILSCSFKYPGFTAFNIGTGRGVGIYKMAEKITDIMKPGNEIVRSKNRSFVRDYVVADINKAKKILNWKPKVSIEEGLRHSLKLFKKKKKT